MIDAARRVDELRRRFVPAYSDTGTYSPEQYDGVRAFMILCHAELEHALEQMCVATIDRATSEWLLDSRPRQAVLALLAFSPGVSADPPKEVQAGPNMIRGLVQEAKKRYTTMAIRTNHGLREANILGLVLPVGIRESDMDTGWISDMDSFGAIRGTAAHTASSATTPPDPRDTVDLLERLLFGLWKLDVRLLALRAD